MFMIAFSLVRPHRILDYFFSFLFKMRLASVTVSFYLSLVLSIYVAEETLAADIPASSGLEACPEMPKCFLLSDHIYLCM